jgi:large subunit ribosomal protein L17
MFRNLAMALFRHERIITTVEKAKEMRPFVERLITLAKKGTLHARRLVISRLGTPASAEVKPRQRGDDTEADERTVLKKLFTDIAERFKDRPGGYTRIIKRAERRLGDAGRTAYIELLKAGETKERTRRTPPPAPVVTAPAETPQQEQKAPEAKPPEQQQTSPTSPEQTPPGTS